MPMDVDEVKRHIQVALPDAVIQIEDLAGDGDHYAATVVSAKFEGLPLVQQHKLVYDAFGDKMGTTLHALALKTKTPG